MNERPEKGLQPAQREEAVPLVPIEMKLILVQAPLAGNVRIVPRDVSFLSGLPSGPEATVPPLD